MTTEFLRVSACALATLFRHPQLIGELMLYHVHEPLELNFLTQFECRWPFVMASIGYGSVQMCRTAFLSEHCTFCQCRDREKREGEGGVNFAASLIAEAHRHFEKLLKSLLRMQFT